MCIFETFLHAAWMADGGDTRSPVAIQFPNNLILT
jgi:hypothetical protein